MELTPENIRERIREHVYDPEIGINVVDLGLLYDVSVPGEKQVCLEMTLTTPGCPLYDVIRADVEQTIREHFGEDVEIDLEWVWDPPWSAEQMSEDAKMEFGYF